MVFSVVRRCRFISIANLFPALSFVATCSSSEFEEKEPSSSVARPFGLPCRHIGKVEVVLRLSLMIQGRWAETLLIPFSDARCRQDGSLHGGGDLLSIGPLFGHRSISKFAIELANPLFNDFCFNFVDHISSNFDIEIFNHTAPCAVKRAGRPQYVLTEMAGGGMEILARRIRRELRTQPEKIGHCAICENELQRLWPIHEENRKQKIAQFANENGFKLTFYKQGLCVIFQRKSPGNSENWNE